MTLPSSQSGAEKSGGTAHSKDSLRLWLRLLSCSVILEKRIRLRLKREFGTTLPRFDVMAALDRRPEGLTMGQLSRQILMSNGNVTGLVARLIAEGLICTQASDADRRIQRVTLTRKGQSLFRRMAAAHERWIDTTFASLTDKKIGDLLQHLSLVRQSIDRNPL